MDTWKKRKMVREQYVVDCCGYPFGLRRSNLSKSRFHGFCSLTKVLKLAIYKIWYCKKMDYTVLSSMIGTTTSIWYEKKNENDQTKMEKRGVVFIPDCNMAAQGCWHSQGRRSWSQKHWIVFASNSQQQLPNVHLDNGEEELQY